MGSNATAKSDERAPFLPPRLIIRAAWKVHRGLYRLSGGRFGLRQPTADRYGMAELATVGRRSGQIRRVIIAYFEDGGAYVTMAMNGWGVAEPAWWLNLQDRPEAELTLPDGQRTITAKAATGDERERLWDRWRHYDRGLDQLAARRPTETAVVILSPVD